jgi:hypothetical protein
METASLTVTGREIGGAPSMTIIGTATGIAIIGSTTEIGIAIGTATAAEPLGP